MRVLALDSSGIVASVAVVEDDTLVAEYTVNYKKTHSQTLLPMLDEIVKMTELDLKTIDAIAVAKGPGSFTGLRIGSATAKGLGLALDKPLVGIPTVEALAYNLYDAGTTNRASFVKDYVIVDKAGVKVALVGYIPDYSMDIMTAKVDKEIRNGANRAMNCDMANVNKTIDAALEQKNAIQRLQENGRLERLPEKLRQTALLRLQYPEMSLSQLAEKCDPPVTKSCMNHRMRKLLEEAKKL